MEKEQLYNSEYIFLKVTNLCNDSLYLIQMSLANSKSVSLASKSLRHMLLTKSTAEGLYWACSLGKKKKQNHEEAETKTLLHVHNFHRNGQGFTFECGF